MQLFVTEHIIDFEGAIVFPPHKLSAFKLWSSKYLSEDWDLPGRQKPQLAGLGNRNTASPLSGQRQQLHLLCLQVLHLSYSQLVGNITQKKRALPLVTQTS